MRMTVVNITDIVIGILFLTTIFAGYRRGLAFTIARLAAMVVSYIAAGLIADHLKAGVASSVLLPLLQGRQSGGTLASLTQPLIQDTAQEFAYALLFFVAFGVIHFILMRCLVLLKVIDHIPVVGKVNKWGGAIAGFLWIFLLCLLAGKIFFAGVPVQIQEAMGYTQQALHESVLVQVFVPAERLQR